MGVKPPSSTVESTQHLRYLGKLLRDAQARIKRKELRALKNIKAFPLKSHMGELDKGPVWLRSVAVLFSF